MNHGGHGGFRAEIMVADRLLLELKAVEALAPIHTAQIITYLKLLGFKRGYLLNLNVPLLKQGIKRISIDPPCPPWLVLWPAPSCIQGAAVDWADLAK
jgi:hypothetical protein